MLATSTYSSSPPHAFLPAIPSPLSPRRAHGRMQYFSMSSPATSTRQSPSSSSRSFSTRPIKATTPTRPDALAARRRDIFLKKVKQGRDERRWEARSEDMMRLDYVTQQRQWEAEKAASAPEEYLYPPEDSDSDDLPVFSSQMQLSQPSRLSQNTYAYPQQDEEIDAVLQHEVAELEALVTMHEQREQQQQQQSKELRREGSEQEMQDDDGGGQAGDYSSVFGSDDEEYDSIFKDFIDSDAGNAAPKTQAGEGFATEEMDLSG